jgi:hypothetical protein
VTRPIVEKVAFALHDSMCPERACETHTMGAYYRSARAVLAMFEPETVTTADELDALPVGSVVLDDEGTAWKRGSGSWVGTGGEHVEPHEAAPLTVIYRPTERV